MSVVSPVSILVAGCQPWNTDVSAASPTGDRFAYCATLAVYIYEYDADYKEFKLHSIMSEHKKTITSISWHPKNPDLFVTSSADKELIIWNIPQQKIVSHISKLQVSPTCTGWVLHEKNCVSFVSGRGPLYYWYFTSTDNPGGGGLTFHKDTTSFDSEVCHYRWHPRKMEKLVFGHADGTLSIFCPGKRAQRHVLPPEELEESGSDEEDPVVALEWDPLSVEYILVATTHHGVRLLDTEALTVIMKFNLPSAAAQVHTLAWVNNAPGVFVTGDTLSGVMRIWSVAKSTPLESLRVKKTGFHCLNVFTNTPGSEDENGSHGGSANYMPMLSPAGRYALPPAYVLCTFMDGGVGLYDMGKRRWCFLRDQGHIETIFDCKFKPESSDLLATASFDGTIKIWNVNDMTYVNSSPGNEGVIYCLSWAPADLNCVVACTSKNGAFIWDVSKGKVIKRFTEHGNNSVFSVAWNQKDSRRIASCGGDGYCIVRQVDGTVEAKFKHPGPAFGCDWSPNNKDIIATGCDDRCVRVFYIPTADKNSSQPLRVFKGHEAKVFNVKWSPLRDGLLCSGSDDGTVRVWDYTKDNCIQVLQGHAGPVRGLLWNTEIPYMLITGSWDYSMRIWDVRDGACLDTVLDHGADVYGLTSHPERPFVFASSSRDSTVRLWSLNPLVQPIEMNILANRPWDDIASSPEHSMSLGTPPILSGKASKEIRSQLEKVSGDNRGAMLRLFSKFFSAPRGSNNIWELVSIVGGLDDSMLSPEYSKGIMHMKHITKFNAAKAQELEMVKMSKFGTGIGAPTKDERLRAAASINLQIGNIQRYCEVLTELGEWDKALAVAPGVSLDYWKTLSQRRVNMLTREDSDEVVPYAVAVGDVKTLIQYFTTQGKLQEALTAATAGYEGSILAPVTSRNKRHTANGDTDHNETDSLQLLYKTSYDLADWYFRNGLPVLAACCHLSVNDTQRALCKLLRGNELELAVSIGTVLRCHPEQTHLAIEYLSRRCEKLGKWDLAVDLLKNIPKNDLQLARLCARCAASMAEINDLHQRAGFPTMDECLGQAESCGEVLQCVKYYMLSTQPERGLEAGLKYVKQKMKSSGWCVDDVWDVLQIMGAIQTEKLQQHKCAKYRGELLVLCNYIGSLVAIRRQYNTVVEALYRNVAFLLKRETECDLPVTDSLLMSELEAWKTANGISYNTSRRSSRRNSSRTSASSLPHEQQEVYERLMEKAGPETSPLGVGIDFVAASQLPCHSDVHDSYFTNLRIQGPAFFLEDGRSAIAVSEALMWAKCTPFSPLCSGVRINPF